MRRFKNFFNNFLIPYLEIEDFIYKYEFKKSDGKIHTHVDVWLKNFKSKDYLIKMIRLNIAPMLVQYSVRTISELDSKIDSMSQA